MEFTKIINGLMLFQVKFCGQISYKKNFLNFERVDKGLWTCLTLVRYLL